MLSGTVPKAVWGESPYCNILGVFYWSIETRVNAEGFSARIAEAILCLHLSVLAGWERIGRGPHLSCARRDDDGFVEFCDVDMRVGGVDGVRHSCGLLGSTRLLCPDASAGSANASRDAG